MQQPDRCLYLLITLMVAQAGMAQDVIYYMNNAEVETKVLEVGLDSIIHVPAASKDSVPVSVPKAFVKYIEYKNGQKYFIEHSKLYLVNGKIVLAHVQEYNDKVVQYQDVYTRRVKRVPTRKVVAIHYHHNERVHFLDKINLWNGQFLAGHVLEVKEQEVTFENVARRKRKEAVDLDKIRSIEFKNGFEQEFPSPQQE